MESQAEQTTPLEFTGSAIERFREVLAQEDVGPARGIRIGISKGGCSGFEYTMKVDRDAREGDVVLERDGVRIFVEPEALPYLEGTTVDYVVSLTRQGFQFENPKASRTCGCGESFGV